MTFVGRLVILWGAYNVNNLKQIWACSLMLNFKMMHQKIQTTVKNFRLMILRRVTLLRKPEQMMTFLMSQTLTTVNTTHITARGEYCGPWRRTDPRREQGEGKPSPQRGRGNIPPSPPRPVAIPSIHTHISSLKKFVLR